MGLGQHGFIGYVYMYIYIYISIHINIYIYICVLFFWCGSILCLTKSFKWSCTEDIIYVYINISCQGSVFLYVCIHVRMCIYIVTSSSVDATLQQLHMLQPIPTYWFQLTSWFQRTFSLDGTAQPAHPAEDPLLPAHILSLDVRIFCPSFPLALWNICSPSCFSKTPHAFVWGHTLVAELVALVDLVMPRTAPLPVVCKPPGCLGVFPASRDWICKWRILQLLNDFAPELATTSTENQNGTMPRNQIYQWSSTHAPILSSMDSLEWHDLWLIAWPVHQHLHVIKFLVALIEVHFCFLW